MTPVASPAVASAAASAASSAAAGTLAAADVAVLYRQHGAALLRLASRLTGGDRYWAEDLLQESMVRAWRHPTPADRPMRPWLVAVLRHLYVDQLRARRCRPREVFDDAVMQQAGPATSAPDDPTAAVFRDGRVATALRGLADIHRRVLIEVYFLDRSVAETAERLRISPGTVKSRLFYGRQALRSALSTPAQTWS